MEDKELTEQEALFLADTLHKELFFALMNGEPNQLATLISDIVEWEKEKLMDGGIESNDYEQDIQTANDILAKLSPIRIEEKA